LIISCALKKDAESFKLAQEVEELRNDEIDVTTTLKTEYFVNKTTWEEVFTNNSTIKFGKINEDGKTCYDVYYFYEGTYVKVDNMIFDEKDLDYEKLIKKSINSPLKNSFLTAKEYEIKKNIKIDEKSLSYSKTFELIPYENWEEFFKSGVKDSYFKSLNKKFKTTKDVKLVKDTTNENDGIDLKKGTKVIFLGKFKDSKETVWYRVCKDKDIGYVNEQFLEKVKMAGNLEIPKYTSEEFPPKDYTDEDVYWLAMAITKELGSSWMPEYARNYVGCVVLNRVESSRYPNTIYGVLHQKGQYPWAYKGKYCKPYDWCVKTAIDLLEGNRMLPSNILYQAEFKQGKFVYATYHDKVLGTTTYFCGV
jgi:hypothetical protein